MEDQDNEQHPELVIDRQRESDEDAVEQHAELKDGNTYDLGSRRIANRVGVMVAVAASASLDVRMGMRERLVFVTLLVRVGAIDITALLLVQGRVGVVVPGERGVRLRHLVGLRAVGSVRGKPVSVCVMHEAETGEAGCTPAEGDELDDEDEKDAKHAEGNGIRLTERMKSVMVSGARKRRENSQGVEYTVREHSLY